MKGLRIAESVDSAKFPVMEKLESRFVRNRKKILGIHGGGNIGLGLVAPVFSRSAYGYQIVATTGKDLFAQIINATKEVWLQHEDIAEDSEDYGTGRMTNAKDIRMIGRGPQDIEYLYEESCLIALCLTAAVLPQACSDIARALVKRFRKDGTGVTILVCMNLPNPVQFFAKHLEAEVRRICTDKAEGDNVMDVLQFIPSVVDRVVVPVPESTILQRIEKQLTRLIGKPQIVTEIMKSPERIAAMVGLFSLRAPLFSAEEKFSFWVPNTFSEARWVGHLTPVADLSLITIMKDKFINGPHAILAWLGGILGRSTIAEAIASPLLRAFITGGSVCL